MSEEIKPFNCSGKWVNRLLGHVKAARTTHFTVKYFDELPIKFVVKHYIETFDKLGNHLTTLEYNRDGILVKEEIYKYTESGLLLELIWKKNGKITDRHVYEYNSSNVRICETWYGENDDVRGHHRHIYDSKGKLLEERWDSRTPEHRWKRLHKYDDNGNLISTKHYKGADNRLSQENVYIYDKRGILIEKRIIHSNGKIEIPEDRNERDENGNIIHSDADMYHYATDRRYDALNRIIEKKIYDSEFDKETKSRHRYTKSTIKYFYNYNNTVERIVQLDRFGNVESSIENIFDANHNRLSSIRYKGESNIITDIYENEYLYYSYKELTGKEINPIFTD